MEANENTQGPSTAPQDAPQSAVASAVAEVAAEVAKSAAPQGEPAVMVSGRIFMAICQYIGSKPYNVVQGIRSGLWQLQQEQNCISPAALPEKVTIAINNVNVIDNFLQGFPHDEVADLISAFRSEVQAFVVEANEKAKQAAAAAAVAGAKATEAEEDPASSAPTGGAANDRAAPAEAAPPAPEAEAPKTTPAA